MKHLLITAFLVVLAFIAGVYFQSAQPVEGKLEKEEKPLYWVAPMDPDYRRDQPGKSPMGMDLVPVYEKNKTSSDSEAVYITSAVENNLGVKTALAEHSVLAEKIQTVGYVRFDEDRLHHIHQRVDGWIETLNVNAEGDRVEKGQVLFEFYSPALFNAQKDLVSVLGSGNPQLIRSARQRLRLLGMDAVDIDQVAKTGIAKERVSVYAMHSGIVSDLQVRHGMYIEPRSKVMAIGAIDTVWVIAEVFERQSAWLREGQSVTISADSYPGEQWQATVDYIYPILNSQARTLQVRVRVDNHDQRLRPNMFTDVVIHAQATKPVIHVPRSAVIHSGNHSRVIKKTGEGMYRPVYVSPGKQTGARIEIKNGLDAGDRVVTSAQFLIDSESNIDVEAERMLEEGTQGGEG